MSQPKSEDALGKGRFADSSMPDLARAEAPSAAGASEALVLEVDSANFAALVERSTKVPVVLVLTAPVSVPSLELAKLVEVLVRAHDGRLLLGKVDLQANPAISEALQVQAVPTVMALINGRALPLFQGQAEADQINQVLAQVLEAAAAAGVTGSVADGASDPASAAPVPPLHQAGFDAIEAGDLAAAREAFTKALAEAPADAMAKAALAQVALLERLAKVEQDQATSSPEGVDALDKALKAADQLVASGHPADGFDRLLVLLPGTDSLTKETIRQRLVELFEVVGAEEPAVAAARRRLAAALF